MGDPEGVEAVCQGKLIHPRSHVQGAQVWQLVLGKDAVVPGGPEGELVRDERMQAVDRRELLGEGVGNPVMVLRGSRHAGEEIELAEPPESPHGPLADHSPPVDPHGLLAGGVAMIAGVHSTVWILAISAALTSRALS